MAQAGGGRLYFDQPTTVRPGPAEIIVEIDGEPKATAVEIEEQTEPTTVIRYRER